MIRISNAIYDYSSYFGVVIPRMPITTLMTITLLLFQDCDQVQMHRMKPFTSFLYPRLLCLPRNFLKYTVQSQAKLVVGKLLSFASEVKYGDLRSTIDSLMSVHD
jgi:hypothetical protein